MARLAYSLTTLSAVGTGPWIIKSWLFFWASSHICDESRRRYACRPTHTCALCICDALLNLRAVPATESPLLGKNRTCNADSDGARRRRAINTNQNKHRPIWSLTDSRIAPTELREEHFTEGCAFVA